jgi:hypothetical protein
MPDKIYLKACGTGKNFWNILAMQWSAMSLNLRLLPNKDNFLVRARENKEIPQLTLESLIADVCGEFGCERETILQKGKKGNLARDMAIYLCRKMTGEKSVALVMYDQRQDGMASRRYRATSAAFPAGMYVNPSLSVSNKPSLKKWY